MSATLRESEDGDHNGHAYHKHVRWTLADFLRRFADEPGRKELSSFPDRYTAEKAYQKVLAQAKKKICGWLSMGGDTQYFKVSFSSPIGYGLKRGEHTLSPRSSARFLFKKTKDGPRIVTAYPIE